jgi:peroxiredoxin
MTLALGDPAPGFSLTGTDGAEHTLEGYASAPLLAIVQSCNHCPYVQAWEGRMQALQAEYGPRGFRLVTVNANDADSHPGDSFEQMVARAREQAFTFDYLHDPAQELARALGSERTPEVFLFDADRRLAYHGAIDDNRDDTAVTVHYLRDAIDALLDGRRPQVGQTAAVGCTVKWKAPLPG